MGAYLQAAYPTTPSSKSIQLTVLCLQLPPSRSNTPTTFEGQFLPRVLHAQLSTTYTIHETIHFVVSAGDPLARRRARHHPPLLAHTIATTLLLQLRAVPAILSSPRLLFLAPTNIHEFRIQHCVGITPRARDGITTNEPQPT